MAKMSGATKQHAAGDDETEKKNQNGNQFKGTLSWKEDRQKHEETRTTISSTLGGPCFQLLNKMLNVQ